MDTEKRDRIIAAVNDRFLKKTHKFGLRVPPSVKVSFDAIAKEMKNVKVAFKILDDDEVIAVGCRAQPIPCHLIFDVKMDFTRKVPRTST